MSLLQGALSEAGQIGGPGRPPPHGRPAYSGKDAAPYTHRLHWRNRIDIALDAERGRWVLWLPVFFGCGIALYLGWPSEPPLALIVAAVIVTAVFRLFFWQNSYGLILTSASLMIALGLATAKLHALYVDAPFLKTAQTYVTVEGWVEMVERQEKRHRLTLRVIRVGDLPLEDTPYRARLSIGGKTAPPPLGAAIKLRSTLMPPPEPALPGGFDFARFYWFKAIGASGYAMGKPELLPATVRPPPDVRLRAAIGAFRQSISERIGAILEGDRAAVAKALAIGDRAAISEETRQALRDSGLAHVIAISGFHMALIAGGMFWLIRAGLALFPGIALRFPIKIWAAVGALVIAGLYLVMSGAAVTAIRAFIMVAIAFLAIILNRPAFSLRNLAIAALIILFLMPQSLMDAGFQMSFAATAALIAYYEGRTARRWADNWPRAVAVPLLFFVDIGFTTLFASFAVDPFAAYHFHRVAVYAIIGNLLAIPALVIVIMPFILVTLIAMPLGLEALPLQIAAAGIDWLLSAAYFTAGLPGAALPVPAFADGALTLIIAGGLWLIIWRGRWRWFGLTAVAAGLALAPFGERPDLWVDRDGKIVAIRAGDGLIETPRSRKASFSVERWMEADGDDRGLAEVRTGRSFQCDDASCVAIVKGKLLSFVQHPAALAEDCLRSDILIAAIPIVLKCGGPDVVIDRLSLSNHGAQTITIGDGGLVTRTVREKRGERPWVAELRQATRIPEVPEETRD